MKVVLREVSPDDVPVFFEHQRDPAATAMAGFPARDRAASRPTGSGSWPIPACSLALSWPTGGRPGTS